MYEAKSASATTSSAIATSVGGSGGLMPYSMLASMRLAMLASAAPRTIPTKAS
jgi:hypothetical protein